MVSEQLAALAPETRDAVEISGRIHTKRPWKSYCTLDFPSFDLCKPPADLPQFDIVLCEQVLEHLPVRGGPSKPSTISEIRGLCRRDNAVPLPDSSRSWGLLAVHPGRHDVLLESAGLRVVTVEAGVTGPPSEQVPGCPVSVLAITENDPILPIVVWAVAQRP